MLLGVSERLGLLNILPKEGNAVTLRILRDFQNELSFTEEEKTEINLVFSDNRLTWDASLAKKKEIEVGDTMKELIVTSLKRLDATNHLNIGQLPLYEKFVSFGGPGCAD